MIFCYIIFVPCFLVGTYFFQIFLEHPLSWPFLAPVDVVGLGIPDYLEVIKKPMDLGTIQKKLSDQEYKRIEYVILED